MLKRYSIILILACIQFGCATPPEPVLFGEPDSLIDKQGTVYLYRADLYSVKGAYPFVFLDEEPQGRLEHQTYKVWNLSPGQYEWVVKAGDTWDELGAADSWEIREQKITVDVAAGKYYFLRLKPSAHENVFGWRDAKFGLVDKKKAIKEMKGATLAIDE
ncbi:DUF2846 domain-containing protein [Alkalimarinus sediminis]|uniref:DUF2846 domain-containing protein n=1 Tax=Alkalimarinus sediminis TaxID=1632866 RepID=A0A9E8HKV6_9ALTE|nr:DUF2846 domain-containing protein [Alkalimarinus sediminis]UZW76500.1 DUF2846 domain-containing protein [Alkalimarinus sediminis]